MNAFPRLANVPERGIVMPIFTGSLLFWLVLVPVPLCELLEDPPPPLLLLEQPARATTPPAPAAPTNARRDTVEV